jgi:hypothetical protein
LGGGKAGADAAKYWKDSSAFSRRYDSENKVTTGQAALAAIIALGILGAMSGDVPGHMYDGEPDADCNTVWGFSCNQGVDFMEAGEAFGIF